MKTREAQSKYIVHKILYWESDFFKIFQNKTQYQLNLTIESKPRKLGLLKHVHKKNGFLLQNFLQPKFVESFSNVCLLFSSLFSPYCSSHRRASPAAASGWVQGQVRARQAHAGNRGYLFLQAGRTGADRNQHSSRTRIYQVCFFKLLWERFSSAELGFFSHHHSCHQILLLCHFALKNIYMSTLTLSF